MSVSPINSIALYEYYFYTQSTKKTEKSSENESDKNYTDSSSTKVEMSSTQNISSINKEDNNETKEVPKSSRPWAEIMYQLGLSFNDDPKDDIEDIKNELRNLTIGIDDKDFLQEINDLISNVNSLYVDYVNSGSAYFSVL